MAGKRKVEVSAFERRSLKKTVIISLAVFIVAFFLWRFLRPLNIFVVDERFERPMTVDTPRGLHSVSARECGQCHEEIYREWSGSMHAHAWTEPYFQVDYRYDGSQQICLNCHTPLVNQQENLVLGFKDQEKFKPVLEPNPGFDPALRDEGVTCAVCHVRDGKIIGPFATGRAPHPVEIDTEMSSGMKPCVRCHVASGERWDTFYAIPACGTVTEIERNGQRPDCIGCHMPAAVRPAATGMPARKGRMHLFQGGHSPEWVKKALRVEYRKEADRYVITLTNTGAAHAFPTGTPDRHLTLELRLMDSAGKVLKEKVYTMKRHILWRPFIVDIKDTRLQYNKPRTYDFRFTKQTNEAAPVLDVTVRYHLLDEKRREKIGFEPEEPISYPIYNVKIKL